MKRFDEISKNNGSRTLLEVAQEFGIPQNRAQFIPGRIYSLKIVSQVPEITPEIVPLLSEGKPYFDLNPVGLVLFHENWKETAIIVNLKVLPPAVNVKLLESYYRFASINGLTQVFDKEGNLLPLDSRRLLDLRFYMVPPTLLSTISGLSNINYAINKYNIDQIAESRIIDWDQFGMLVNPKLTTFGLFPDPINLEAVFEDFIQNSIS